MDLSFYQGKTVIITGATGYIANNIIEQLKAIDCEIIRISRGIRPLPTIQGRCKVIDVIGHLQDPGLWQEVLADDIIFHLAAQTSIPTANKDPVADLEHNIKPLLLMLESCRQLERNPHIVLASTVTTYGLTNELPVSELQQDNPLSIYDLHKTHGEQYLKYYIRQGYVSGCALRLANVYGPGVTASSLDRGILNMMVRKALQQEPITIYGEGDYLRDYIYVDDVGSAFLAAGMKQQEVSGQHFIISSGHAHSFKQAMHYVANNVKAMTQQDVQIQHVQPPSALSPIDLRNFEGDSRRFQQATTWQPHVELTDGIKKTVNYYNEQA